jgi:dipeptidyl aminopeptidase/acylaminoacyl peptidase
MMRDQDFEDRLAAWLEDGPTAAPDAPVEAAIDHARSHPRRVHWWSTAGRGAAGHDLVAPVSTWRVAPRVRLVWILAVTGAMLALLAATLIGSHWSLIVRPPGNGLLAFSYEGDIWTVAPGRDTARLTTGGLEAGSAPTWSPDGHLLAIRVEGTDATRPFRIDILDVASGTRRTVATGAKAADGRLAFSPDGTLLAFGFGKDDLPALTIARVDGSSSRTVPDLVGTSPAFSPDGRSVAFAGRSPTAPRTDLYVADVATLGFRRLTTSAQLGLGWVSSPSWAGDGQTIVFETASVGDGGALTRSVDAIRADGTGLRELGRTTDPQGGDAAAMGPVVSRDGRLVAFQADGALEVREIATGATVDLAAPADLRLGAGGLAWAPDGTRLAALRLGSCSGPDVTGICLAGIVVVRVDHSAPAAVEAWSAPGQDTPPTFSWELAWQAVPVAAGTGR